MIEKKVIGRINFQLKLDVTSNHRSQTEKNQELYLARTCPVTSSNYFYVCDCIAEALHQKI
jgi:hypothetical protein